MCGIIYTTYRSCGHRLDSGEVEPCEDGIISGETCAGPDGKPPGEPYEQVLHLMCPPCEKEQQELDDELDSPIASWISDQRSRASKAREQAKAKTAASKSTRQSASQRSASTAQSASTSKAPGTAKPSSSRASTKLTPRQAEKQPVYPAETESAITSEASTEASRDSRRSSTAILSQAGPRPGAEQPPEYASSVPSSRQSAASSRRSAASSKSGDRTSIASESRLSAAPQTIPLPDSSPSSVPSSSSKASSRKSQARSAVSSDYASTVKQARSPAGHAASRASSMGSAASKNSSHSSRSGRQTPGPSRASKDSREPATDADARMRSKDVDEESTQTDPAANQYGNPDDRSQATQYLEDARNDLNDRLTARDSRRNKRSLLSRVLSRKSKEREPSPDPIEEDLEGLSDIIEQSEGDSMERSAGASEERHSRSLEADRRPQYNARDRDRDPSYIHPDDHPSQFPVNPPRRRRRRNEPANETAEEAQARLLKQEQADARRLDREVDLARRGLEEAEDIAYARDLRRALEESQTLLPHEELQEENNFRRAMRASLQKQRDVLQQSTSGEGLKTHVVYGKCRHRVPKDASLFVDGDRPAPRLVHQPGLCDDCELRAARDGQSVVSSSFGGEAQAGPSRPRQRDDVSAIVEEDSARSSRRSRSDRGRQDISRQSLQL